MMARPARKHRTPLTLAVLSALIVGCTFGSGQTVTTSTRPAVATPAAPTVAATPAPITPTTQPTATTTAGPSTTTSTIPKTTTTTIALVTEGAVVIVANASGVTGAANKLTTELTAAGFHMGKATNAAGIEEKLDVSKVYFMPAGADVASSIGLAMGGVIVSQMPVPVWITGGPAALGDATVVVMLGKDLSGKGKMLSI
jgi:LytR cell envelope-related transcriptional attenuator